MARYVYLIRNGQYDRDGDQRLTPLGRDQATRTAYAVHDLPIRAVHCSPHTAMLATASLLAESFGLTPEQTPLLRQYDEQMKFNTLSRKMLENASAIQEAQLEAAYVSFFQRPNLGEPDSHEVIVCHANIIRDLICKATGVSPATWAHMIIHHCGISCIAVQADGKIELLSYDDIRHLPDSLHTE